MESTYFGQSLILMPIAGTSRLPYQPNGLAGFLTEIFFCIMNLAIVVESKYFSNTMPTTAPTSQLKGCVGMDTESVIIDTCRLPRQCY